MLNYKPIYRHTKICISEVKIKRKLQNVNTEIYVGLLHRSRVFQFEKKGQF